MPETIESLLAEGRTFPPPDAFKKTALVTGADVYEEADADFEGYWARQADALDWFEEWHTVLEWDLPFAKWFVGGKLNVAYNCLDRHVASGHGDQVAYHWEGEPGDTRTITYAQLLADVSRLANALLSLGVARGDRVCIYLGMVPELPMALLACARIGAPHSVVFGGFSSDSLRDRIQDAEAKVVVTADGAWRRGQVVPLKQTTDTAVAECPSVEKVLVLRRTAQDGVPMTKGRDVWWHDVVPKQSADCPPEVMDAEDLLYLLYTSGTTARPKGIMHTTAGYLTQVAHTHKYVFDLNPDTDVYWCSADVGWVTGHSYIVYGPLANRTTSVLYEGTPDFPDKDRLWAIAEKYGVTILYTAPTAIRTFMKWGAAVRRETRSVVAAAPRQRRRADQPGGLGLVLAAHRRWPLPGRRHLVADRDGRHHDQPAARRDDTQAGERHLPATGRRGRRRRTTTASPSASPAVATSS